MLKVTLRRVRNAGATAIIADVLVAAWLLAWLHSVLTGGVRRAPWGIVLSNRDTLAVFLQLLVVGGFRYLVLPRQGPLHSVWAWFVTPSAHSAEESTRGAGSWLASLGPWSLVFLLVVVTRLAVLGTGAVAAARMTPTNDPPRDLAILDSRTAPIERMQHRWDAGSYASIANDGYAWDPASPIGQNVAFFPAFPFLVRAVSMPAGALMRLAGVPGLLGRDAQTRSLWIGVFVSIVMFGLALKLLFHLAALDLSTSDAKRAILLAATYPFAVFYSAPYTESLYLLATVGAFLACRLDRPGWMIVAGLAAGLTRQAGFLVSVPLLIMVFHHRGGLRAATPGLARIAGALSPALGTVAYCAFLGWQFGEPLAWVKAQWAWTPSLRWQHMVEAGSVGKYIAELPYEAINLAAVLFVLPWIWRARRLHVAYLVLGVLAIGVPLAADVMPLGRMTAPIFPVFLPMAVAFSRGRRAYVVAAVSFVLQLAAAQQFYSWRPIY